MDKKFDIQEYMTHGVENIVSDILRATYRNPKESVYMLRFAKACAAASKRREASEKQGDHVPAFLIASITSRCNLHCEGCYSRCSSATADTPPERQLTDAEWLRIFEEAGELGVSFILLAGGEPLLRQDVIEAAGTLPDILFPVFTNGTYIGKRYFELFDRCRNLVPVISIEGGKAVTDSRRGEGVYDLLIGKMDEFYRRGLVFGASVTVTKRNITEVTSGPFLNELSGRGCKAVIFVEYVPVDGDSGGLAPGDEEREYLKNALARLRSEQPKTVYVSFPGDEKESGGCVAAGRGFFHINSHGGAEPCPFSPYSDISVRDLPLKEALKSPLFTALREDGLLDGDHAGGCVLYEKRVQVEKIVSRKSGSPRKNVEEK